MSEQTNVNRHWHARSESYTGGDSLATALLNDWVLCGVVSEEKWGRTHRCVIIHHFELIRDQETVVMAVISNPWIERFIASLDPAMVHRVQCELSDPLQLIFTWQKIDSSEVP